MSGPRLVAVDGKIVGPLDPGAESVVRIGDTFAFAFYDSGVVASHNGQFGDPAQLVQALIDCIDRMLMDAEARTMSEKTGPGFFT